MNVMTLRGHTAENAAKAFRLLAVVCAVCFAADQAEASIIAGGILDGADPTRTLSLEEIDQTLERLGGTSSATGTGAGSSSSQPAAPALPPEQDDESPQYAHFLLQGSGSSGGSTSSTSSVGAAGGVGLALSTSAAVQLADESPARRFAFERALSLPDAPGTELLRPPQA